MSEQQQLANLLRQVSALGDVLGKVAKEPVKPVVKVVWVGPSSLQQLADRNATGKGRKVNVAGDGGLQKLVQRVVVDG